MKIHMLQCGCIRVDPTVPFGKRLDLIEAAKQLTAADKNRITLPVFTYLIEHPKGLILVDTGWCRDISPRGVYDPKAAAAILPSQMAALFHPFVPKGMAIHEQLADLGIQPEDLDYVLLTHLDVDHVAGLRHVNKAKHIVLPEYEYYWSCRTVYKVRQPQDLWIQYPMERPFYRGSPLGPNHWVIDLFGDESIQLVNVPGHTEGQAAVVIWHLMGNPMPEDGGAKAFPDVHPGRYYTEAVDWASSAGVVPALRARRVRLSPGFTL
jgi:glyoxylase-like metal-dependent hydrolase (beta-lactamase superfamily II)